jgi:hypothetical protein
VAVEFEITGERKKCPRKKLGKWVHGCTDTNVLHMGWQGVESLGEREQVDNGWL